MLYVLYVIFNPKLSRAAGLGGFGAVRGQPLLVPCMEVSSSVCVEIYVGLMNISIV